MQLIVDLMDGWLLLLLCSDSRNDVPPVPPRNVSIAAERGAVRPSTMDGWMDNMRFYIIFNSISVISGRWANDNERQCAMEHRLRLRRFRIPARRRDR